MSALEQTLKGLLLEEASPVEQPPVPQPPPADSVLPEEPVTSMTDNSEILSKLEELKAQMAKMQASFDGKMRYDESKQQVIDRQHNELERYRQEESAKLSKAIMMDMICEIDSAEKNEKFYESTECTEENFVKLKKLVLRISEDLRDLLERHDVFAYRSNPGDMFDAKRQRVLKTVPTGDQSLNRLIQESIRWGFEREGKVIRPEQVAVYSYDPALQQETAP